MGFSSDDDACDLHLLEKLLFKVEMALIGWHVVEIAPLLRAMSTAVFGGETDAPNWPYDVAWDGDGAAI